MTTRLKLLADNGPGLEIISAAVQDAILKVGDIAYNADGHNLTLRAVRFMHESNTSKRVQTALRLDNVLSVRVRGINRSDPDAFLVLLSISLQEQKKNGEGHVHFVFAGGGTLIAHTEYIEARLVDLADAYDTKNQPLHPEEK
jgi:hypothetical protein